MKKIICLFMGLLVTSILVAEDRLVNLGLSYMNSGRTFDTGAATADVNIGGFGLSITNWTSADEGIVGVVDASFLMPVSLSASRSTVTIKDFDGMKLMLDSNALLGYMLGFNSSLLFLGGGIHFNGVAVMSDPNSPGTFRSFLSYTVGAGLSARLLLPIADDISFTVAGNYGYDFVEIANTDSTASFVGGSTFALTAGMLLTF